MVTPELVGRLAETLRAILNAGTWNPEGLDVDLYREPADGDEYPLDGVALGELASDVLDEYDAATS